MNHAYLHQAQNRLTPGGCETCDATQMLVQVDDREYQTVILHANDCLLLAKIRAEMMLVQAVFDEA